MKRILALAAPLAMLAVVAAQPAQAADYEVKMLNRGAAGMMVFEPAYLKIAPGDTVTFVPADKGHNAQSIPGMTPDGAKPFRGAMNKPVTVTFDKEGVYGYKCLPHFVLGMVGVVEVGDRAGNLEAAKAKRLPGKAGRVMSGLLDKVSRDVAAAK